MPKAFTETEKNIIHQRLMDAARQAFGTYGLQKTNIEDLTRPAGISKGAFYLFYPSKERIYFAVLEEEEQKFRAGVHIALSNSSGSPYHRLRSTLQYAFSSWRSSNILKQVSKNEVELMLQSLPPEELQAHLSSDAVFVEALIEHCREQGIPMLLDGPTLNALLNALFVVSLYGEDFALEGSPQPLEMLINLVAARCTGIINETDLK